MMKHIIHDWDDERATQILRNCHRAMQPRAKVLIVDAVIPPGNRAHFGKLLISRCWCSRHAAESAPRRSSGSC